MTRRLRRGFTLIELLVVIGVLMLLVGIAVLAFSHFENVASAKLTTTRLANCESMTAQFDTMAGLSLIEGSTAKGAIYNTADFAQALGDVTFGVPSRYSSTGVVITELPPAGPSDGPVLRTGRIFQKFCGIPDLKTTISHFPGEAMLQAATGTGGPWNDDLAHNNAPLPVIVDGWKNPIIFVPSGGLRQVYLGGVIPPASWVVPTGYAGTTSPEGGGQWAKRRVRITSLDGRPFWASAGPDGSFQTGDDNLYSRPISTTTGGDGWGGSPKTFDGNE